MSKWRTSILEQFLPGISKLTIVSDPDNLLTEEKLATELTSRGFELLEFTDPIEFRYAFEAKYRGGGQNEESAELIILLGDDGQMPDELPYDIVEQSRSISVSIPDLFPQVSYPVVEALDRSKLDELDEALQQHSPGKLGENATKDFVLRTVYRIAPKVINDDVSLLRVLLQIHYSAVKLPEILSERAIHLIQGGGRFLDWDLENIFKDHGAFFHFLQERWPFFLSKEGAGITIGQKNLKHTGPISIPFDHPDIRVYIDNLFAEGKLVPVDAALPEDMTNSWLQIGILQSETPEADRIKGLWDIVEQRLPDQDARYSDWQSFSLKWAELSSLHHRFSNAQNADRYPELQERINVRFINWLGKSYASLATLPPTNPVMVHHIPRYLAREMQKSGSQKVALLVVDGLALDQWTTIRSVMNLGNTRLSEGTVFAWIPTLTSISRQSIFAGKPPLHFPDSLWSTNREEKLWQQFWERENLPNSAIVYRRGLGDGNAREVLGATVHPTQTKVVGLVVDKVDKIMHGMELGASGMHNQIQHWGSKRYLEDLIQELLDLEFDIWLTADHGNTECVGIGRPTEGSIAETRGERARVYSTDELRFTVLEGQPNAIKWTQTGLPPDCYPLVLGDRSAFIQKGKSIVAHGGTSIEEVLVPFIRVIRGDE